MNTNKHTVCIAVFIILILSCITQALSYELLDYIPPRKTKEQYTIVVFTAQWCNACKYLKESLNSKIVRTIIKNQYKDDIYFVDIDLPENKKIVQSYLKFMGEPSGQIALPMIAIVHRPNSNTVEADVLIVRKGAMSIVKLALFLTNPAKYKKKPKDSV